MLNGNGIDNQKERNIFEYRPNIKDYVYTDNDQLFDYNENIQTLEDSYNSEIPYINIENNLIESMNISLQTLLMLESIYKVDFSVSKEAINNIIEFFNDYNDMIMDIHNIKDNELIYSLSVNKDQRNSEIKKLLETINELKLELDHNDLCIEIYSPNSVEFQEIINNSNNKDKLLEYINLRDKLTILQTESDTLSSYYDQLEDIDMMKNELEKDTSYTISNIVTAIPIELDTIAVNKGYIMMPSNGLIANNFIEAYKYNQKRLYNINSVLNNHVKGKTKKYFDKLKQSSINRSLILPPSIKTLKYHVYNDNVILGGIFDKIYNNASQVNNDYVENLRNVSSISNYLKLIAAKSLTLETQNAAYKILSS